MRLRDLDLYSTASACTSWHTLSQLCFSLTTMTLIMNASRQSCCCSQCIHFNHLANAFKHFVRFLMASSIYFTQVAFFFFYICIHHHLWSNWNWWFVKLVLISYSSWCFWCIHLLRCGVSCFPLQVKRYRGTATYSHTGHRQCAPVFSPPPPSQPPTPHYTSDTPRRTLVLLGGVGARAPSLSSTRPTWERTCPLT